ncbi:hypothetical protein PI95_027750, partial [Hassallia byssoidea VB512170]
VLGFPQVEHLAWQGSQCGLGVSPSGASGVAGEAGGEEFYPMPNAQCPMTAGAPLGPTPRPHSQTYAHCPMPNAPSPTQFS